MNITQEPFQEESINTKVIKAIAAGLVAFLSIFGNILVICAVWLVPRMKTITNYLIVNMALSDLLYVLIVMPPLYIEIFDLYQWATSDYSRIMYLCKFLHFAQYFLISASVLTLTANAVDRFVAIVLPLKRIFTKKVFHVGVAVIWVVSAGVGAPALFAWSPVYIEDIGAYACEERWNNDFEESERISILYSVLLFAVAYCTPFFSIAIMYTIVCRRVWRRKVIQKRHKKQYRKAIESRKKVVKMLITVVIAFVVCWLPLQIATLLWHYDITISKNMDFICKFLMRMHTATSPWIYAVFSENYRRGFRQALKCCCGQQSSLSRSFTRLSMRVTMSTRRSSAWKIPRSREASPDHVGQDSESPKKLQSLGLLRVPDSN